jgi:guanosine-3',5'-bis(diphosphate) 3'-pyrophosphohydrolase
MDPGLLLSAIEFAAHKHRDQRRKDQAKSPYINHPIAVARLLWQHGVTDPLVILAAVLHEAVAATVVEVTDDKSLPKQRRKELQIEHAPKLSSAAKLVKLADKTCNLRDMVESPPHDWSTERRREYFAWAERVVVGLRGINASLEAAFDEQRARGPR